MIDQKYYAGFCIKRFAVLLLLQIFIVVICYCSGLYGFDLSSTTTIMFLSIVASIILLIINIIRRMNLAIAGEYLMEVVEYIPQNNANIIGRKYNDSNENKKAMREMDFGYLRVVIIVVVALIIR